ncbi:hypothetical protein Q3G72_009438 [Acer saccharum]|nr:hypothetical protein Q3G72_009438 [Acer saccharum]
MNISTVASDAPVPAYHFLPAEQHVASSGSREPDGLAAFFEKGFANDDGGDGVFRSNSFADPAFLFKLAKQSKAKQLSLI